MDLYHQKWKSLVLNKHVARSGSDTENPNLNPPISQSTIRWWISLSEPYWNCCFADFCFTSFCFSWLQDRRFLSFSKGCHLGLRRDVSYSAVVIGRDENTVDVRYTNPSEWADGASGFTNSLGSSLKETLVEADVDIRRVTVLPESEWYWNFWQTWERGELPRTSSVGDFLFPPESEVKHLKLADAFADTERGHLFRCELLVQEKEMLHEDFQEMIQKLMLDVQSSIDRDRGRLWPRQADMAMAKRLFLKLLRTPFWMKWIAQGGESPSKVTTLFGKKKFVRLVLR